MPEHRFWQEIDVWYYSLALVGIVVLFISSTRDREIAISFYDLRQKDLELYQIKRSQPVFSGIGMFDDNLVDVYYDLSDVISDAENCTKRRDLGGKCAAVISQATIVKGPLAAVGEPPINPPEVLAVAYQRKLCSMVAALSGVFAPRSAPATSIPGATGRQIGFLTSRPSVRTDPSEMMRLRSSILGASAELPPGVASSNATNTSWKKDFQEQSAQMGIKLLNSTAACLTPESNIRDSAASEKFWFDEYRSISGAERSARDRAEKIADNDSDIIDVDAGGSLMVDKLLQVIWPFILSLAVALKLVRAVRDRTKGVSSEQSRT